MVTRRANKSSVTGWAQWYKGTDGFEAAYRFYHIAVTTEAWSMPHSTNPDRAVDMAGCSPKVQALCKIILLAVFKRKDKLLVFVDWPLELWYIVQFLTLLGLRVGFIRAGQTSLERDAVVQRFKSSDDNRFDILVCSSRAAATSVNLQNCHHVAILGVVSVPIVLQIVGRVCRIGQTHRQFVFLLTIPGTLDDILQARSAKEHIPMLTASMDLKPTRRDREELLQREGMENEFIAKFNVSELSKAQVLNAMVKEAIAIEAHGTLLGQRVSRGAKEWLKSADAALARQQSLAFAKRIEDTERARREAEDTENFDPQIFGEEVGNSSYGTRDRKNDQSVP